MPDSALPSVLIVRMSAAGDIVHTMPMVHALRRAWPECRIGWVVEDRFAALLDGLGLAHVCHTIPRRAWREWSFARKAGAMVRLVGDIRRASYAAAIDAQGLLKSALIPRLAGIPRRIGYARASDARTPREGAWLLYSETIAAGEVHVARRNCELLRAFGIAPGPADYPPVVQPAPAVEAFLRQHGLPDRGFMVLNPGAGWPAKRWPIDRFHELAQRLRAIMPVIITWGGAAERAMAEAIGAGNAGLIAPETNLAELWHLVSRARLFIGCDTGPLHMADAAGTPCVALFGPTDARRNGPLGSNSIVVQSPCLNYPKCWSTKFRAACRCMQNITVDMAYAPCAALLA